MYVCLCSIYIYIHIMYLGDFSSEVRVKSCFLEGHVSKAPPVRWDMLIQLDLIWFSPNSSENWRIFFTKKILQVAGTILLGDDLVKPPENPARGKKFYKKKRTSSMWKARGHQLAWRMLRQQGEFGWRYWHNLSQDDARALLVMDKIWLHSYVYAYMIDYDML